MYLKGCDNDSIVVAGFSKTNEEQLICSDDWLVLEAEASAKVEEEVFGVLQLQWTESL